MPPKAFPFSLGIGIDVIQTARLKRVLHDENKLNRWAQRIFTRLEWPSISHTFQQHATQLDEMFVNESCPQLVLPKAWPDADGTDPGTISPLTYQLARLLAGRFVSTVFRGL